MKRILVLNLFPTANPPVSGGQIRCFHIYNKLSQSYDITLLSQSYRNETIHFSPTFREYRVQKDPRYNQVTKKLQNELQINGPIYEFNLIKNIKLSNCPTLYKKYYDALSATSDIIIHESPYMLGYDRQLGLDGKPRIYNSHNHEFLLAKQLWKNAAVKKYLPIVYELENKLVNCADLVFATSEKERDSFIATYNLDPEKVKLAPNGINPEEWIKRHNKSNEKVKAFFIGADYPPNVEAVNYIVNELAVKCPDIDFIIAGACCSSFQKLNKSNVKLLGKVNHKTKLKLFAKMHIAINPVLSGAGVNLKTLEFLSAGIPLFSTQFGARGLNLIDKKHYFKVDPGDFPDKINKLCHDKRQLKKISLCGQKYINDNYSWSKIAKNIKEEIDNVNRHVNC
jgi:glycosyltransferase involved in cell wall biosynthesis